MTADAAWKKFLTSKYSEYMNFPSKTVIVSHQIFKTHEMSVNCLTHNLILHNSNLSLMLCSSFIRTKVEDSDTTRPCKRIYDAARGISWEWLKMRESSEWLREHLRWYLHQSCLLASCGKKRFSNEWIFAQWNRLQRAITAKLWITHDFNVIL